MRFTWINSNWPDTTVASIVGVTFDPVGDDHTVMVVEHFLLPLDIIDEFRTG